MKKWMIIQTRARWEKKVQEDLCKKGIECYCPVNVVQRKWSDRVKLVHEPLFKKLVFVKINAQEKPLVRTTAGVINFIYSEGKLSFIKERELQSLKSFLEIHQHVEVEKIENNGRNYLHILTANGAVNQNGNGHRKILSLEMEQLSHIIFAEQINFCLS